MSLWLYFVNNSNNNTIVKWKYLFLNGNKMYNIRETRYIQI